MFASKAASSTSTSTSTSGLLSDMPRSGNCGNWCSLPGDIWFLIGLRLDAASDRVRFRAVSKTLRSNLPYRQPPWLMLSEYHESDSEEEEEDPAPPPKRRFVVLGEQRYYKWDLPQAHLARCVGSAGNWVITVKTDRIIRLLNPFSKLEIDLPSQLTFEHKAFVFDENEPSRELQRDTFLIKAIIYSPPSGGTETDFFAIAIQKFGRLAMAKPGDSFWTTLQVETKEHAGVRDIVVYKGRLYAINFYGLLLSCDLTTYPHPPQLSVVALPQHFDKFQLHPHPASGLYQILYLVEWCGHLLLVIKLATRLNRDEMNRLIKLPSYKTHRFQLFKFDFTTTSWIEIKSLGEYSLFLGFNTSVSVLASDYFGLVKNNCIYFTDDNTGGYRGTRTPGGYDMGVFHLEDGTITPHYNATSTCLYSPPIWIVPP